jgi:hypothetical protein
MGMKEDIWYAARVTRVVLKPRQVLETFGTSCIRYHLVSELLDDVNKVRVRAGRVYSERPQIITPEHFGGRILEGFGDQAREYAEWLRQHGELVKILQYGLQFRKDQATQEIISDSLEAVSGRVKETVERGGDDLNAVIVGADELWEVSLLKFIFDFIHHSAPTNLREINQRNRERREQIAKALRDEVEADFAAAAEHPDRLPMLGEKLERLGLFDAYEDRFYGLMRSSGSSS